MKEKVAKKWNKENEENKNEGEVSLIKKKREKRKIDWT